MKENYRCSICGKTHRKLWRPYMDTDPLACATCLEERQSPQEYNECNWVQEGNNYVGKPTGRKLALPRWKVNCKGKIPSYSGPGPDGKPQAMTDKLIVDLSDVSKTYSSGNTTMIPAVPKEDGDFYGYTTMPEEAYKWWENLPTQ